MCLGGACGETRSEGRRCTVGSEVVRVGGFARVVCLSLVLFFMLVFALIGLQNMLNLCICTMFLCGFRIGYAAAQIEEKQGTCKRSGERATVE